MWSRMRLAVISAAVLSASNYRPELRSDHRNKLMLWVRLSIMATSLSTGHAAIAEPSTCQLLVHIDHYKRPALRAVASLLQPQYVLTQIPYVPVSTAQRQRGQSEAARIAPGIAAKNPDIVILHGSTFSGSNDARTELRELIQELESLKPNIRAFVIYSSARLTAASLSLSSRDDLSNKLEFIDAPIYNRFGPDDPSATELLGKLRKLCEAR